MAQIIPAILSTREEDYQKDIARYQKSELLKTGWVHIDFMDNKFVPNQSIKPSVTTKYPINLHKEAHLMVTEPMEWIDDLAEAGFERVIIHIEADSVNECLNYIAAKGLTAGLAINSQTPVEKVRPFVDKIEIALVMTVKPGFQGQPFIPEALSKLGEIKQMKQSLSVGVDGGVNNSNAKQIVDSGADFLAVGSYLLKGNIDENLENLLEALQ